MGNAIYKNREFSVWLSGKSANTWSGNARKSIEMIFSKHDKWMCELVKNSSRVLHSKYFEANCCFPNEASVLPGWLKFSKSIHGLFEERDSVTNLGKGVVLGLLFIQGFFKKFTVRPDQVGSQKLFHQRVEERERRRLRWLFFPFECVAVRYRVFVGASKFQFIFAPLGGVASYWKALPDLFRGRMNRDLNQMVNMKLSNELFVHAPL